MASSSRSRSCASWLVLLLGPLVALLLADVAAPWRRRALATAARMLPLPFAQSSTGSPYYSPVAFNFVFAPLAVPYSLLARAVFAVLPEAARATDAHRIALPPAAVNADGAPPRRRRLALVTGANTGIGFETARLLVQSHGVGVVLACRSRAKAVEAARRINSGLDDRTEDDKVLGRAEKAAASGDSPTLGARAIVLEAPLDLLSPHSIASYVEELADRGYTIDILVNNAGRNTYPDAETEALSDRGPRNGLFQANFLGHYELTARLMARGVLRRRGGGPDEATLLGGPRVVNLSSVMHHFVGSHLDVAALGTWRDAMTRRPPPRHDATYALSKLAMLLFTRQLNQLYGSLGLQAVAVNPGAV